MIASMGCLALLLLLGGLLGISNAGEDLDHIFSSDPVLLAISEKSSAYNTWLTCANKQCSVSKRQPHENVYSHGRKVFHIYANGRSKANDAIRYGDEVALFYKENDNGFGVWLSCQSKRKQCGLGTCPGLPHFKHWMWNTTSCYQNRFLIANSGVPIDNTMEQRHPVKVGDEISLIRKTDKISDFVHKGLNDYVLSDADGTAELGEAPFHSDSGKWIIQKDMISKCGHVSYDVRYKTCDRCGSRSYVRPKHESWQCCGGEMPFNPIKSICCDGLLTNISNANRDAKEARCCANVGFFPNVQMCCDGEVHYLPGQDTDADDSTVQCCGNKPYLTARASCDDNVLTPLTSMKTYEKQSSDCCDEKASHENDDAKCCNIGKEKEEQGKCLFRNNTYMSGERFSDGTTSLSCRSCICQDGTTVCDTVSSCPAILPHGCYFYPANGECCPVFECLDDFRDNNYQLFLTRSSHVSVKPAIPELDALTISVWIKTEQDSEGTLLSYATERQSDELVVRTHPTLRVTFQGTQSREVSANLNDGSWHFVCIQWKSSTGQWFLFVDDLSHRLRAFNLGRSSNLKRDGHLVLGRRQQSPPQAFVGSIAYFNIWDSKINFISQVKTDCLGLYEGNVVRWSVATIDTNHSASIIDADRCADSTTQDQIDESNRPDTQQFTWEVFGDDLRSLSGTTCQESSVYRIRSAEYSFKLKVCPSATEGSLGNLQFIVLEGASDSPLYWPFPYPVRLSVIANEGKDAIYHDLRSGADRRKFKAWSLVTEGGENDVTGEKPNPDSSVWQDFITVSDARNNYNSEQQLRVSATVYTERYGDWLYWNGHYYSHRNRLKRESWYEAEANCIANGEGVHLVSIHSEKENNFVKSRASDEQWIGLTDTTGSSTSFTWADRSNYGFTNWAPGEPQQATWHGDCGAMRTTGKWVDVPCRVQKANADTAVTIRSFTCKTPGKSLIHQAPPSLGPKVTQENEAGVFSVDLSSNGQTTKVTFITGLHYTVPNMKFPEIADRVRYGANMAFGKYTDMTPSQLGPLYDDDSQDGASPENDVSGVADLDGVVDKIIIPHYDDMNSVGNTEFSIEFWISPRRMPLKTNDIMALFSKSSSSSSFFNLNVKSDGSIEFSVTRNNGASPLNFATNIANEDCKVKPVEFQHIAVTGNVASSLKILINGEICYTMSSADRWREVTSLPASSDAPLVFGVDTSSQDSSSPKKFNGQMCYIRVYDEERTQQQIQSSMNAPYAETGSPVGLWPLRRSQEIKLIHYVISDSNGVSDLKVLKEFVPAFSSFPVVAIERDGNIYVFRITEENQVVAKEYTLNRDTRKLQAVSPGHINVMSNTKEIQRGCFTVARVINGDRFILITCRETNTSPPEVVFSWNVLKMHDGEMTAAHDGRGSLRVAGIGGLDTRPSATVVDRHLLLAAGTRHNAEILFLDLKLDRSAHPKVPRDLERIVPITVGPNIEDAGVTYYSYLFKPVVVDGETSSSKTFLRRVRPQDGEHSSNYRLAENIVDPSSLTANAIGNDIMPENDWFWFLFKISTLSGGSVIQSGQRVSIQTPDNNPQNEGRWSFVKCNPQNYLEADQQGRIWNFYIFKTKTCDPSSGGYTVVKGDIGPNDCILLWPRTLQFCNLFCQSVFAYPTPEQIQGAQHTFGAWFGPWHIMVPLHPTPVRPLPQPPGSPANSLPRNVHEGNKYALLRFGETITVPSQSRVKAALLRFARTSMAPVVVSNSGSTPPVKLIFRGNGGTIPLTGALGDTKAEKERELSIVYREGSYAQKRMTSGLFYSISYTPPSNASLPGEFKNLARIHGFNQFEYPKPPQNFVWLVPPPFKINGICEAVSKFYVFDADAVETTAPNSVDSLSLVLGKAVGPGSFNEGLFKPLLTVPIDVTLLHEIGQRTYKTFTDNLRKHIPQPPEPTKVFSDSATRTVITVGRVNETDPMWQEVGDVEASLYLANMSVWKTRVERQRVEDKLNQLLQSDWMKQQMIEITSSIAPEVLRNVSLQYSAYGGLAVVIASRLRSSDFLEQLVHGDLQSLTLAVQSHLPVLDALRPDLGIAARKDIISTIMARSAVNQPWDVLKGSTEKDKAIKQAFDALLGRNVPEELSQQTKETLVIMFKALFSPLTTTQLGIISQTLNIKKQGALEVHSERATRLKTHVMEAFETKNAEKIATFAELPDLTGLNGKDLQTAQTKRTDLLVEQENLLTEFQKDMLTRTQLNNEFELRPASRSSIKAWLTENPQNFAKVSHTFNAIGSVAALGCLIIDIADPDSGLRKGETTAIISTSATLIGAIGSFHGTATAVIDLGKLLKQKLFPKLSAAEGVENIQMRVATEVATENFQSEVAERYAVDFTSIERVSAREANVFTGIAPKLTNLYLALGVVADLANAVVSIMSLVEDVKNNVGPWKIIDDAGMLVTATAGAVVGVLTIVGVETGPAAIIIGLVGLIFMISDAVRAKKESERKLKEARCNAWKTWCNWSKALFVKHDFLIDPTDDPCVDSNCPDKRGLLRALCFRGLKGGLEPGKAISFGIAEHKTCPAWLRHFYKRRGSHKGRKEKSRKQAIRSARRDL